MNYTGKLKLLNQDELKLVKKIVRLYCQKNKIYASAHLGGIGPDQAEECIEHLLDDGQLVIELDDNGNMTIAQAQ